MVRRTVMPAHEEIQAALERVLASATFARARRAQEFLRFVVGAALQGRSDINGYTIAVEVFRKSADFDAVSDPLVRVEAGRVRSRLREYYAGAGALDAVRIDLEVGGYVPLFRYTAPEPQVAVPPRAERRYAWAALFGVVAVAILVVFSLRDDRAPSALAVQVATEPKHKVRVLVEPFVGIGEAEDAAIALGLTEEVMSRLARYRDVEIYVSGAGRAPAPVVDYILSGSVRNAEPALRVAPRLVAADSGRQVWAEVYERDHSVDTVWSIVDAVAEQVVVNVGEPYGPMFDAEVARIHGAEAGSADVYQCGLRFLFAIQVMSPDAHARATACFEHVVAADPASSMAWARLASLYRMQYQHDFNVEDEVTPPLDRAYAAVLRALDADYGNAFAHEELGFIALLRDDRQTFEDSIARALELSPTADIRTAIGINFVRMGETARGLALLDEGIASSPRTPPIFFVGYVVEAMRMCDFEAAVAWNERMEASRWPMSQAFMAANAALSGRPERASRALERLLELRPDFRERGRELISRGKFGSDIEAVLTAGLEAAGLVLQ
jgi:adenylate cyclase